MMIKTMIFTHRPHVSLAQFTFCWWCHNLLLMMSQWPDNYDVITWIVLSNLLDIDFIHVYFHSRSCKKMNYLLSVCSLVKNETEILWDRIYIHQDLNKISFQFQIFRSILQLRSAMQHMQFNWHLCLKQCSTLIVAWLLMLWKFLWAMGS